ncbi:hypothetical protein [Spirillospora sp. CA-128828]|uniref:hypothetical protein n=1 Tax=Spirillospora sp. CA-128828 TaxID=3240033 RepID=UPI003D904987
MIFMRKLGKLVDAVLTVAQAIVCVALALLAGVMFGSSIDMLNGGLNDPIKDGAMKGAIIGVLVLFVAIAILVSVPDAARINKKNKLRVAAQNTKDAAMRREAARASRQYWKRVYWNRTH